VCLKFYRHIVCLDIVLLKFTPFSIWSRGRAANRIKFGCYVRLKFTLKR
jgi:hypothetical protein